MRFRPIGGGGGSSSGGGLTVGTTTITSGTNGRVLFDNSGVVGEYTITGTGSVAMSDSPVFTTQITTPAIVSTLGLSVSTAVRTSGVTPYLTVTAPADTTLTASTEAIGVSFVGAIRQHAAGALTTQREYVFAAPTYSFASASTITTAATVAIAGPPVAGTNATITNSVALNIQTGRVLIGATSAAFNTAGALTIIGPSYGIIVNDTTANTSFAFGAPLPNVGGFFAGTTAANVFTHSFLQWLPAASNEVSIGNDVVPISGTALTVGGRFQVTQLVAGTIGQIIKAAATPTGDMLQIQTSAGSAVAGFGATGFMYDPGISRVTADVTNATATFAVITGLSATLIAGRKYCGELVLYADDSTAVDGLQIDFNGGTATATSFAAALSGTPIGATVGVSFASALATALTATTATTGTIVYVIKFSIVCNAAGTFIPRFAQVAHTTGTATVRINSDMTLRDSPT